MEYGESINTAVKWMKEAEKICFFLGAGMSSSSGIYTKEAFKNEVKHKFLFIMFVLILFFLLLIAGDWLTLGKLLIFFPIPFLLVCVTSVLSPQLLFFLTQTSYGWIFSQCCAWIAFKNCFYDRMICAKPNIGHKRIAKLSEENPKKEMIIVTQNVDNLEREIGFNGKIYQLCGNFKTFVCYECMKDNTAQFCDLKKLPFLIPKCINCKKRSIRTGSWIDGDLDKFSQNQHNQALGFVESMTGNDVMIIVGSSGSVGAIREFVRETKSKIIEVNIKRKSCFPKIRRKRDRKYLYIERDQEIFFGEDLKEKI